VHHDPNVDSQISQHMQIITNEILRCFGKVDSIMLAGGFVNSGNYGLAHIIPRNWTKVSKDPLRFRVARDD